MEEIIETFSEKITIKPKLELKLKLKIPNNVRDDKYTIDLLKIRYKEYRDSYNTIEIYKMKEIPLRHQNPPEDMTENIVKFIIRNYENDKSCIWCKGLKMKGDLYSDTQHQIEVKAFTSNGPCQFSPSSKFDVLYFLDLREFLNDKIILWKVKLTSSSEEFKNIKVNKIQTHSDQCKEGRRPHINFTSLYPQIKDHCKEIYNGSFENIFQ